MNQTNISKHNALEKLAPHVYDMYKQLHEERTKIEPKLNYFFAIDTLLLVGYVQLFATELKDLSLTHIGPTVLLLIPVLILLTNFSAGPLRFPWFEKEQLVRNIDNDTITIEWLVSIYNCAYLTWIYMGRRTKMLNACLTSVGLALAWMFVAFIVHIGSTLPDEYLAPYIIVSFFSVAGVIGYAVKRACRVEQAPDFGKDVRDFFGAWASEREVE